MRSPIRSPPENKRHINLNMVHNVHILRIFIKMFFSSWYNLTNVLTKNIEVTNQSGHLSENLSILIQYIMCISYQCTNWFWFDFWNMHSIPIYKYILSLIQIFNQILFWILLHVYQQGSDTTYIIRKSSMTMESLYTYNKCIIDTIKQN